MPSSEQGTASNPLALDDDDEQVLVLSDSETEVDEEDEDAAFSAASHLGSPDTDGEAAAAPGALASIVEEICRLGTFRGVGLIVSPTGSGKTLAERSRQARCRQPRCREGGLACA